MPPSSRSSVQIVHHGQVSSQIRRGSPGHRYYASYDTISVDYSWPIVVNSSEITPPAISTATQRTEIDDVLEEFIARLSKDTITIRDTQEMTRRIQTLSSNLLTTSTQLRSLDVIEMLARQLSIALTRQYDRDVFDRARKDSTIRELERSFHYLDIQRQPLMVGDSSTSSGSMAYEYQPPAPRHKERDQRAESSSRSVTSSRGTRTSNSSTRTQSSRRSGATTSTSLSHSTYWS